MESYQVISGLKIKGTEIVSVLNDKPIFVYQGSADGACGPYSLFIILMILGKISYDNLPPNHKEDNRTGATKFFKKLKNMKGLVVDGTTLRKLKKLVVDSFPSKLKVEECSYKNADIITYVIEKLKQDIPTIIGVMYQGGGGHWMVAVGYCCDENNKPAKLLFLDPGSKEPTIAPWNTYIEIAKKKKGDYPYHWDTNGYNISFDEALSICSI